MNARGCPDRKAVDAVNSCSPMGRSFYPRTTPADTVGLHIYALLPDGTENIVWREGDTPAIQTGRLQLVVGPREPTGPSVRQE